eukprot:scaffold369971_cov28-Prasinocladus_malaysianus.AAC.2
MGHPFWQIYPPLPCILTSPFTPPSFSTSGPRPLLVSSVTGKPLCCFLGTHSNFSTFSLQRLLQPYNSTFATMQQDARCKMQRSRGQSKQNFIYVSLF